MPELRTLEVAYAKGFQTRAFLDMVESRWRVDSGMGQSEPMVTCLRNVTLRGVPSLDIFDVVETDRLQKLEAEGLNVKLNPCSEGLMY